MELPSIIPEIPLNNFYRMLCYAWDVLNKDSARALSRENFKFPINIIASEICRTSSEIIKRRQTQAFEKTRLLTSKPRGAILFSETLRKPTPGIRSVVCEFETLTRNTLQNQILKAALRYIKNSKEVSAEIRLSSKYLEDGLIGVSDIKPLPKDFKKSRIISSRSVYRHPLSLSEMLLGEFGAKDVNGSYWFESFLRDEHRMRMLYEAFIRNFLKVHLNGIYSVGARRMALSDLIMLSDNFEMVPFLNTDITISRGNRHRIIDTKFSKKTFAEYYGKKILRSDHLYQIMAYVNNLANRNENNRVEGVVLYPKINEEMDVLFYSGRNSYRFVTIDLTLDWEHIEKKLISIATQEVNMLNPT